VVDFWRWQPHPEVWLLVAAVITSYVYAVRVIGPKAVAPGVPVVTRAQVSCFVLAVTVLWLAADWPMHDIAEEYLYSVHMTQHILLAFVLPPLALLATPEWLARLVVGSGRVGRGFYQLARPLPAAILFNGLALLLHWQVLVNASVSNALLHYVLHVGVVSTGLLLWIPVCGPFPERRLSHPGQMLYLFVTSIVPTVPAAWLTFADGAVYSAYDIPARLWGVSVTTDQQVAGLIMKLGAGGFLWVIITMRFFQWAKSQMEPSAPPIPAAVAGVDELAAPPPEAVESPRELTPSGRAVWRRRN
jgi:putative membrane protein